MAQKIVVTEKMDGETLCRELERGNILFFEEIPFPFPKEDIEFLLQQKQTSSRGRKNIAYKPHLDRVTNSDEKNPERLHEVLKKYSQSASSFLEKTLTAYRGNWELDYASFRPFQEKGRDLRIRARNDLLHVDAFPTRPVHGARILRFFTNINPEESRRWITSSPFGVLAERFGGKEVPFPKAPSYTLLAKLRKKAHQMLGGKSSSPYDRFMLSLHNFLKESGEFQEKTPKDSWEFPPFSCWAVFTDLVSHAALSGQYALEQTFRIPEKTLLYPELSPVSILERLSGRNMV